MIYYDERVIEGTVGEDSGATIKQCMQSLTNYGACAEIEWPYDITKYTEKPPEKAYEDAKTRRAKKTLKLAPTSTAIKTSLANGQPVVIGFSVPSKFEDVGVNGMYVYTSGDPILGGHAICVYGYNDELEYEGEKGFLLIKNSWGSNWALHGYCWIPYSFVDAGFVTDAWVEYQLCRNRKCINTPCRDTNITNVV